LGGLLNTVPGRGAEQLSCGYWLTVILRKASSSQSPVSLPTTTRAEVPLPPGVAPPSDDVDDLLLRKQEPQGRDPERERWNDLGLEAVH